MESSSEKKSAAAGRIKVASEAVASLLGRSRAKRVDYPPAWVDDRLGYWPVEDRGGIISAPGISGSDEMLGVLARIEMNEEDGRSPGHGLPPDALKKS